MVCTCCGSKMNRCCDRCDWLVCTNTTCRSTYSPSRQRWTHPVALSQA